jgi:hypothetical protein
VKYDWENCDDDITIATGKRDCVQVYWSLRLVFIGIDYMMYSTEYGFGQIDAWLVDKFAWGLVSFRLGVTL